MTQIPAHYISAPQKIVLQVPARYLGDSWFIHADDMLKALERMPYKFVVLVVKSVEPPSSHSYD